MAHVDFDVVEDFAASARGRGGFGSMTTALPTEDDLRVLTDTTSFKFSAQTTEFDLHLKAQTDRIWKPLG